MPILVRLQHIDRPCFSLKSPVLTNRPPPCSDASNLLFDPDLGRITGLIDYDFATILHPSYEFLRSFNAGGQFRGWYVDEESDEAALREAKLHGFPSPLPPTKADDGAVNC